MIEFAEYQTIVIELRPDVRIHTESKMKTAEPAVLKAWDISDAIPTPSATLGQILHFAMRCAVLALSSHNSQPWRYKILDNGLLLMLDRRRALPVVDPYDRELIISCGAALFNIRVALAHAGKRARIDVQPDNLDEDLLVQLTVDDALPANQDVDIAPLFPAITKRTTNRSAFKVAPVAQTIITKMKQAASAECIKLSVATKIHERESIATLIAAADLAQFQDVRFRRELASWLHPARSDDGLAAFSGEMKKILDFATPLAALIVRTFDVGSGVAADDKALAAGSPLLACLSSATDDAPAWLATGQALQRVLLTAVNEGLDASYLNQPIEVVDFRDTLVSLMHTERFPQLLLRIGHSASQVMSSHSPRRALAEVVS